MSSKTIVGIDLGTSYSLVGAMQAGVPTLFPNANGQLLTPSAVGLDDEGRTLVGEAARARQTTHPHGTAVTFKRDMGTARAYDLGGKQWRPERLSAAVLGSLKQDAEAVLGKSVEEAVITVPAYFGDQQRQATRDAGEIAGLRVERIINEPTAAALAYGLDHQDRELRAVVLDLGGGTFDVTILEIIEGIVEIQASAGDTRLGGEDFTDALVQHAAAALTKQLGSGLGLTPTGQARLRAACERVKRSLTEAPDGAVVLPQAPRIKGRPVDVELVITRDAADELWRPLLERMSMPIRRALRDAAIDPAQIDEVLLVGGATRMPCVVRLATELFQRMPQQSLPPDEAVAIGAVVQAALKAGDEAVEDLVVTDVAPFSLGIASSTSLAGQHVDGIFSPIIHRGTVIPVSRVSRFVPIEPGQRHISVEIYQGEHSMVRDNTWLGEYSIPLPYKSQLAEQGIDVRLTYDLNGLLEVETTVVATGKKLDKVIQRRDNKLSQERIEEAREQMKALKFHPRETLPNQAALARGDALYAELIGVERDQFGRILGQFRAALETQDPDLINQTREILVAATAEFRR